MFELSIEKLVVIGLIAAFLIGPERLPAYAERLARLVRVVRSMADDAKGRLQDELGPDADWQRLDPRQYDPRRIIRNALTDEDDGAAPLRTDLRPAPPAQRSGAPAARWMGAVPATDDEGT